MGAKGVRIAASQSELNDFVRFLLKDVQALERMLRYGMFETGITRIGAEQEICLIDAHGKPAPKAVEILAALNDPMFTTEIAKFNLELNLEPLELKGDCLSHFANTLKSKLQVLLNLAMEMEAMPILTGILPTIRKFDVELGNLTPMDRYYALIEAINLLRGQNIELKIEGADELNIRHSSALIEACNTSFQVHLQIDPDDFVRSYNWAQAITAPLIAISTNSPMLFGKRLWSETRIALFQQSVDTRLTGEHLRYTSPRVNFGESWLRGSIAELYKEGISRFRVLLICDIEEDVFKTLNEGGVPALRALSIHNSTVYRWNRPCYGISPNGKPHLRIEQRVLPAGPTVDDEVANSAFWIGMMVGAKDAYPDITRVMDFQDAKANFFRAAKNGLGSRFNWVGGKSIADTELIAKELLPLARHGLSQHGVNPADIDKYLGIIEERNRTGRTGSVWLMESYSRLLRETSREEASIAVVAAMARHQQTGLPGHTWPLATLDEIADWEPTTLLVEEFMVTDVFTITENEIPEFCADMMDWQRLRYIPIENDHGELVGLISSKRLLRYFASLYKNEFKQPQTIQEIMIPNPVTITPEASLLDAIETMQRNRIGCLPVVTNNKLVGVITESDFVTISASLIKRLASKRKKGKNSSLMRSENNR